MVVPVRLRSIKLYNQLYMTHSIKIRSFYCTSYLHPVQQSHFICMQNTYYSTSCVPYGRFLSSLSNQSSQKWPIIHCYNPSISQLTSIHIVLYAWQAIKSQTSQKAIQMQQNRAPTWCSGMGVWYHTGRSLVWFPAQAEFSTPTCTRTIGCSVGPLHRGGPMSRS